MRWPGRIKSGQVSDLLFYQPDVLPTLAALTDTKAPADIDGLSILPTLLGSKAAGQKQRQHEFLYWEFRAQVAVRMENWKAIRPRNNRPWELYDLSTDVSETNNVAVSHPDVLERMKAFAERSHVPARPGSYTDRTRHERDRWAKWGSSRQPGKDRRKVGASGSARREVFRQLTRRSPR